MAILSATGTARKRTIPALQGSPVRITALHGRRSDELARLGDEHSIPSLYEDYERLLDEVECDFVFVASPPHLHAAHIQAALRHGRPVLCEKPLADTAARADAIRRAAEEAGVLVRIAHHLRHQAAARRLKDLIRGGELGPPRTSSMQWGFRLNHTASNASWKLKEEGWKGPMFDVGVHAIDAALMLFGKPTSAHGVSTSSGRLGTTNDAQALTLSYSDGLLVQIATSYSTAVVDNALTIAFDEGSIRVPHFFGERCVTSIEVDNLDGLTSEEFERVDLYQEEVEDFARELHGVAESNATSTEEAVEAMRLASAVLKTAD